MRRYYQPLNSGSTSEQRTGRTEHEYAQQRHFNALQDAAEFQTVKQQAAVARRKESLTAGRATLRSNEEQKALDLLAGEDRIMKKRAIEDQKLSFAHAKVADIRAGGGIPQC